MSDKEQEQLEEKLSKILSEKLNRKVVFADTFKIISVPVSKDTTEVDIILEPKDPNLPAVCMDLLYLIRCYGEAVGITKESVKLEEKMKKGPTYVS